MIVVSNTAPIIYLASIEKLSVLKELYNKVYIPSEVWNELIRPLTLKQEVPPDIPSEIKAREEGWLIVTDPEKEENIEIALELTQELGHGESYAIALSIELSADLLLINDRKAKEIAEKMKIKTKWIAEVLLDALEKRIIPHFKEFREILDGIIEKGLWITKEQYTKVIENANEYFKKKEKNL